MPRATVVPMLLAGFVVTVVFWWLLGHEQEVSGELRAGQRVQCVSYTPFSATENPTAFRVERSRLEHDFSLLAPHE